MLKVESYYFDPGQFYPVIRGARNPLNSWHRMDTQPMIDPLHCEIGSNDIRLLKNLAKGGDDDAKFLRNIWVHVDITAPLYWWKQFMTYRLGVEVNSCSTMHTIHKRDYTLDDFSVEHLSDQDINLVKATINNINIHRAAYVETSNKNDWYAMIQLLPDSFNQYRSVSINYQAAHRMYLARRYHRLDEWHTLLNFFVEKLPYFAVIYQLGDYKPEHEE